MNTVQLYKNPVAYPHYSNSLTAHGQPFNDVTPRNMDYRTGYVDLQLTFNDVMGCNYLSFTKDGKTVFAWITNVEERGGDRLYRVHYNVDAWRTYKAKITLDNQWILRSPVETDLPDSLLASTKPKHDIERMLLSFPGSGTRYLIVQVREGNIEDSALQPSPYTFYVAWYPTNGLTPTIEALLVTLEDGAKSTNIVTMYSVPYCNLTGLPDASIQIKYATEENFFTGAWSTGPLLSGWKKLMYSAEMYVHERFHQSKSLNFAELLDPTITRVPHSVQVVFPDAGIMSIPDELLGSTYLHVRQDVDMYSGSVNYTLCEIDDNGSIYPYNISIRGGGSPSIPILSNPMDTYMSQNQSALITSLIGDTAMLVGGVAAGLGAPGIGTVAAVPMMAAGAGGLMQTAGSVLTANRQPASNPPAMLASALAPIYDNKFWVIITRQHVENEAMVHERMGYPQNCMQPLTFPTDGFIKTQGCTVKSDGTVPLWAIKEINEMFDNGIEVQ